MNKNIYPSLAALKQKLQHFQNETNHEWQNYEPLDLTLEAELEEEAARDEEERFGSEEGGPHIFLSPTERIPQPPPYALAVPSAPLLPLPAPLIQELSKTEAALKAQIGSLKQVLHYNRSSQNSPHKFGSYNSPWELA